MLVLHHCIEGLEHPWIFGTYGHLETQWILRGKHMQIKHTNCPAITQCDDLPSLVAHCGGLLFNEGRVGGGRSFGHLPSSRICRGCTSCRKGGQTLEKCPQVTLGSEMSLTANPKKPKPSRKANLSEWIFWLGQELVLDS